MPPGLPLNYDPIKPQAAKYLHNRPPSTIPHKVQRRRQPRHRSGDRVPRQRYDRAGQKPVAGLTGENQPLLTRPLIPHPAILQRQVCQQPALRDNRIIVAIAQLMMSVA
jgi:hypothetical protein